MNLNFSQQIQKSDKSYPLVSIICLCHNQTEYVTEALDSVLRQTYPYIELIVVDDASTDGSKKTIQKYVQSHQLQFIDLKERRGNCKAFNQGYNSSSGRYVIDLAADDILMSDRVEKGVATFREKGVGVEFCNVLNTDAMGNSLGTHFKDNDNPPEGDLYEMLIQRYIVSTPGMMISREVLEDLNGYDEALSYEDFDFWIRSSRKYTYGYTKEVLVKKRHVTHSLSERQFQFASKDQQSTLVVCQKIKQLNQVVSEDRALRRRCLYEIKNCIRTGNFGLIFDFLRLIIY